MKTILSLLLLPTILLAQPHRQYQKEHFDIEFSIDFYMESVHSEEFGFLEFVDGSIELLITIEVFVEELEIDHVISQFSDHTTRGNNLARNLNTYSLVGSYPTRVENNKLQERLDHLLALNDSQFPKVNTLLDWLNPVSYQQNRLAGVENIPEGFGPRIKF